MSFALPGVRQDLYFSRIMTLSAMYKRPKPQKKRSKRSGDQVRGEALVAARTLLLDRGPAGVTVANVADAIGMSHANVLHHFGSAAALRTALMGSMVADLTDAFGGVVELLKKEPAGPREVVDKVFDAFAEGGAGQLASWIILTGEVEHLEPVRVAVRELVEAIVGQSTDADADARVRLAVLMMAVSAYGDAMVGPYIRDMLGQEDAEMRDLLARILPLFLIPSGIPDPSI